jgi:lysophospholipase L1-like esterase
MAYKKKKSFSFGKGIWFMFLFFVGLLATLAYQSLFQPDKNNPTRYANGSHRPGRKAVVIAGADMVRGQISFNYVDYLSQKTELQGFQFINAGINSDLSYNLLKRLGPIVACKPSFIIIQIGANDLIGSRYPKFAAYFHWVKRVPADPDLQSFRQNLTMIVKRLKQNTKAQIALVGLPMVGEAIRSGVNQEVVLYNHTIENLAKGQKVGFLPVYPDQVRYLTESRRTSAPEWNGDYKIIGKALLDHVVSKTNFDEIAFKNGCLLHTDGVHLNSPGAMMIARQVENFLKK